MQLPQSLRAESILPTLADSFGVLGLRAVGPDDLGRCLRVALDEDRPSIIEVPVEKMQDPWPLIQGH